MELAVQGGRLRPVLEDIRFLGGLYRESRDLRIFIESPGIEVDEKRRVMEAALRGKLDELVVNFIELLVAKGRQFLLPEIFAECEMLYDVEVGRLRVEAVSAVPLDEGLRKELVAALEAKMKKTVVLRERVDPDILGGLVIRVSDQVADASVRSALEGIASRLDGAKIGSEFIR
jgi:F-type H+-transporting ATPase subunit delta